MSSLYVKIIGNNHGNYPYRIGLNTLKYNYEVFDPEETCGPGGLYYTLPQYIFHYVAYGDKVCILTIPTDAQVVTLDGKRKSDRFIINQIMPLWNVVTIEYLVSLGADIHVVNDQALRWASATGHLEAVKYLVSKGANIHKENDQALQWAAEHGHLEVVKYLVSLGADVHADNDSAIQWASDLGHLEVVKYLVSVGADIHAADDQALRLASGHGHLHVVQYIQSIKLNKVNKTFE